MNMTFNYSHTERFEETLELDDAPNCCLKAYKETPFGTDAWYLIMNTDLGWTDAEWFGPFNVVTEDIDSGKFYYSRNYFECKDKSIKFNIDKFLNKTGGDSFQVEEVSKKEAYEMWDKAYDSLRKITRRGN